MRDEHVNFAYDERDKNKWMISLKKCEGKHLRLIFNRAILRVLISPGHAFSPMA